MPYATVINHFEMEDVEGTPGNQHLKVKGISQARAKGDADFEKSSIMLVHAKLKHSRGRGTYIWLGRWVDHTPVDDHAHYQLQLAMFVKDGGLLNRFWDGIRELFRFRIRLLFANDHGIQGVTVTVTNSNGSSTASTNKTADVE